MSKLNDELRLGEQAKREYEAVKPRLDLMKEEVHRRWESSPTEDKPGREDAYLMLKVIRQLEQSFKVDVDTGKLAKAQLEKEDG